MQLIMLKSKLHRAAVTDAERDYEGSITIDARLMAAARIQPYEKVLVANIENGERFETYAIAGEADSGTICLNGATAHKGKPGDRVIIFTFCVVAESAAASHKPVVIVLDAQNRPVRSSG